jgi:hypothetical protein
MADVSAVVLSDGSVEGGRRQAQSLPLRLDNLEVVHRRKMTGGAPSALFKLIGAAHLTKDAARGKKGNSLPKIFPAGFADVTWSARRVRFDSG